MAQRLSVNLQELFLRFSECSYCRAHGNFTLFIYLSTCIFFGSVTLIPCDRHCFSWQALQTDLQIINCPHLGCRLSSGYSGEFFGLIEKHWVEYVCIPYSVATCSNSTMLPVQRCLPSESGHPSRSTKCRSLSKVLLRWVVLACLVTAVIWFGDSLSLRLSETWFRSSDSTDTTLKTSSRFQRPLNVPPPPTKEEQDVWEPRKTEVRNAFKHAWSGYKSIAYPNDELLPVSGGQSNK